MTDNNKPSYCEPSDVRAESGDAAWDAHCERHHKRERELSQQLDSANKEIERLKGLTGTIAMESIIKHGEKLKRQLEEAEAERDLANGMVGKALRDAQAANLQVEALRKKIAVLVVSAGGAITVRQRDLVTCDPDAIILEEFTFGMDHVIRVAEKRVEAPAPANWDKIIGAIPDMPDHPELLRKHPLTCGECRAEIRTDMCPKCVALSEPVSPDSDLDEQT